MHMIRHIQQVLFLLLDSGLENLTRMAHLQSRASLKDIEINFYQNDAHCVISPMTKTRSFSYFIALNVCRSEINDCLRGLLEKRDEASNNDCLRGLLEKGDEASNNNCNFVCKIALLMLGKVMIIKK